MRTIIVLVCAWLCFACVGPAVRSDIAVFHRVGDQLQGASFYFIDLEGQAGSLEHESYCGVVGDHLIGAGMRQAPTLAEANILIAIDYFIGAPMQRTVHMPVFGQTGVSGSTTTGVIQTYGNTSAVQARTTYTPTYGVTGYVPVNGTAYQRGFTLLMYDSKHSQKGDVKPVYEGRVSSVGSTGALPRVLPTLIAALFEEFPGTNGDTRTEHLICKACNQ